MEAPAMMGSDSQPASLGSRGRSSGRLIAQWSLQAAAIGRMVVVASPELPNRRQTQTASGLPSGTLGEWVGIAVAMLLLATSPAVAQSTIDPDDPWAGVEQMIVTGSGSVSQILAGTTSVTAFDAGTLDALGVDDISDLSDFTPNLEIVTAGTTSPTFFVRGVGLNDFSPLATSAISIYQDDVPRGAPSISLGRLFDIGEVAVLRGPQGTGPYRNASAGAIRINPKQPTGEFDGFLTASAGNFDYIDVEGAVDTPVIPDLLAIRTSFGVTKRGGWMNNRCGGLPPLDQRPPRVGARQPNEPPHSLCGESVTRVAPAVSTVPAGLPSKINDKFNWAIRSIFRFTPDLPLDTAWSLNLHFSRVRDDSHVGQRIGIQELQAEANGDRRATFNQAVGSGPLNTAGVSSYADADEIRRLAELNQFYRARCGDLCFGRATTPEERIASREANLLARRQLARELTDLDSDPFNVAVNRVGKTRNSVYGFALKGDTELNDSVTVRSVTGFERWYRSNGSDLDFTPDTVFTLSTVDRGHQVSQEIRFLGQLDDEQLIDWEVGALVVADEVEVYGITENMVGNLGDPPVRDYEQTVLAASGYVEANWQLTEDFSIDGGARWNYERKAIDYTLSAGNNIIETKEDVAFDSPTGRVRLQYEPTEEASFYVMYNRGWKAGSYNATSNIRKGVTFADPERLDAIEFGWALTAFDGRVSVTGALFYYDYYNYQIFTAESNLSPAPEFVTINANSAQVYGAELEAILQPFEGTNIRVNFGWLESEFLDFTQFQLQSFRDGAGDQQLFEKAIVHTGNRLLNSPQYTVSIIASQLIDLGRLGDATFSYSGAWTDDVFFDSTEGVGVPNNFEQQILSDFMIGERAYWLHNLGLDYAPRDSNILISLWVRNLTNEAYRNFSADLSTFLGTTLHFIGDPRTFGATLRVDF